MAIDNFEQDELALEASAIVITSGLILGTEEGETIIGTEGGDVIHALGGSDDVFGLGGSDILLGESGNDALHGGDGADELLGSVGNDVLFGDAGADSLDGGFGNDIMDGGEGDDSFNNVGGGIDVMLGGGGNDFFNMHAGTASILGGTGFDTAFYGTAAERVGVDLEHFGLNFGIAEGQSFSTVEEFILTVHNDAFVGDGSDNIARGFNGTDLLSVAAVVTIRSMAAWTTTPLWAARERTRCSVATV